jgi:hypothetical protein
MSPSSSPITVHPTGRPGGGLMVILTFRRRTIPRAGDQGDLIRLWTTRADTIFPILGKLFIINSVDSQCPSAFWCIALQWSTLAKALVRSPPASNRPRFDHFHRSQPVALPQGDRLSPAAWRPIARTRSSWKRQRPGHSGSPDNLRHRHGQAHPPQFHHHH